jgi:hypothetical protein
MEMPAFNRHVAYLKWKAREQEAAEKKAARKKPKARARR